MVKKKFYRFYIEPIGRTSAFTNESIAAYLSDKNIAAGMPAQIRYNGKAVSAWLVSHEVITRLENSTLTFRFKFRVYSVQGEGEPRIYRLYKKGRFSAVYKKAKDELEKIQAKKIS